MKLFRVSLLRKGHGLRIRFRVASSKEEAAALVLKSEPVGWKVSYVEAVA